MSEIMDSNSNQVSGMGLPQPSGGGVGSHIPVTGGVPGMQAASPDPAQAGPLDSTASVPDEELDLEWVNKAKDIVEQAKADPFTLSNELNKVKAEYLKVRFSKELNIGEKSSQ